ncbi:hypothetical protein ES703_43938 [subsurface metagenome]
MGISAYTDIRYNTINYNTAASGGGIWSPADTVSHNIISYNSAGSGGGIVMGGDETGGPEISNNTINYNTAQNVGGRIVIPHNEFNIRRILKDSISYNSAPVGAGIYYCYACSTFIDSCTISNNNGDGVTCDSINGLEINFCDIADNSSYGIRNLDTVWINAEYNWWGDSTGPYHPDSNPGGLGDTVSDYVDFFPWLYWPGVEEKPIIKVVEKHETFGATIFSGPLQLPEGKKCKVFDVTGRIVEPTSITRGIYFIEIDGVVTQKVVKIR